MIYSLIHPGSGLGNQLHRFVAGKVLAADKGYEYSAFGRENFKGKSFMDLDFGAPCDIPYDIEKQPGKIIPYDVFPPLSWGRLTRNIWEEKTNYYNPEFNFIEDNTIIDGEFQSSQYFAHRMIEINDWLKVKELSLPDDLCVIGFRGGEFYLFPELGLPKEYFTEAIEMMKKINPNMRFEVHTDDAILARKFFPDFDIIQNIEINWRSMRYAKHAIIANSSFYILPRLLVHHQYGGVGYFKDFGIKTIAPRYWARRNTKEWSMPQNYYRQFIYI